MAKFADVFNKLDVNGAKAAGLIGGKTGRIDFCTGEATGSFFLLDGGVVGAIHPDRTVNIGSTLLGRQWLEQGKIDEAASCTATARSQLATSWQPAAVAVAWTRAITGLGQFSARAFKSEIFGLTGGEPSSLISAPACGR